MSTELSTIQYADLTDRIVQIYTEGQYSDFLHSLTKQEYLCLGLSGGEPQNRLQELVADAQLRQFIDYWRKDAPKIYAFVRRLMGTPGKKILRIKWYDQINVLVFTTESCDNYFIKCPSVLGTNYILIARFCREYTFPESHDIIDDYQTPIPGCGESDRNVCITI